MQPKSPANVDSMSTDDGKVLVEILEADAKIASEKDSEKIEEKEAPPSQNRIPVEVNVNVRSWLHYFAIQDRERFQRFLDRGSVYKPMVLQVLRKYGIPTELYYLGLIESGYVTHATSRARAVGIWQFIRSTGHLYGLKADHYVDERMDPIRATESAARYLRDLHDRFNSWYLAIAAYNAGERRISNAIRRSRTRDFWKLARMGILPRETMNYVPKFLAAVIIGNHPEKYGFQRPVPEELYPQLAGIQVPSPVRLADVARLGKVDYLQLKKYNPHLKRGVTPPGRTTYKLWIPDGRADSVAGINDRLVTLKLKNLDQVNRTYASYKKNNRVPSKKKIVRYHRVRRGDTLHSIAQRYQMSVQSLKRINGLRRSTIYSGQSLVVYI